MRDLTVNIENNSYVGRVYEDDRIILELSEETLLKVFTEKFLEEVLIMNITLSSYLYEKLLANLPKYKVMRVYKNTNRRDVLEKNLGLEEAKKIVSSFPNREKSMVIFVKQK
jgi:hypothetical protein